MVAQLDIVCILLADAIAHNWLLFQVDINNTFLHGFLKEEIYIKPLPGYDKARLG